MWIGQGGKPPFTEGGKTIADVAITDIRAKQIDGGDLECPHRVVQFGC
jgi:hypothetical protein